MSKITPERLKQLEDVEYKMQCLESGGVDSWEFYGEALKDYRKAKEREESFETILEDLMETLSTGAYEPSERGAGFSFREEQQIDAMSILVKGLNDIIKSEK